MSSSAKRNRPDRDGTARSIFLKNRKALLNSAEVCAICGLPLDRSLKFPHPMSASADHIIPIALGGDPKDPDNLQAVHLICNQIKGSKLTISKNKDIEKEVRVITNNDLPLSCDWSKY